MGLLKDSPNSKTDKCMGHKKTSHAGREMSLNEIQTSKF